MPSKNKTKIMPAAVLWGYGTRFTERYSGKLQIFFSLIFIYSLKHHTLHFIYNLTNDCTIISNTIITNNMLLHVSTFKMSSSGSSLCLTKISYRFSGLSKIKLKYKINFNKMLIVQLDKTFIKIYHFIF